VLLRSLEQPLQRLLSAGDEAGNGPGAGPGAASGPTATHALLLLAALPAPPGVQLVPGEARRLLPGRCLRAAVALAAAGGRASADKLAAATGECCCAAPAPLRSATGPTRSCSCMHRSAWGRAGT
jgi:hypothetical protein